MTESGKYILVVEDNDLNYQLVEAILAKTGCTVARAVNGQEAIEMARKHVPLLIYMDIQLPLLDGLSATRILRGTPETQVVPIIALTALAMKGDEEKALAAGCDGVLTKPISPKLLREVTQRYLSPSASPLV